MIIYAIGVPLCFLKLTSLRGPTVGPLIPKVMPTVKNICAGHNCRYSMVISADHDDMVFYVSPAQVTLPT